MVAEWLVGDAALEADRMVQSKFDVFLGSCISSHLIGELQIVYVSARPAGLAGVGTPIGEAFRCKPLVEPTVPMRRTCQSFQPATKVLCMKWQWQLKGKETMTEQGKHRHV